MATEPPEPAERLALRALADELGPTLVLDGRLRVVGWNDAAEKLVGTPITRGVTAASLLCSDRIDRPLAEALSEGRPVNATIPRPRPGGTGERRVRVRARPLGQPADEPRPDPPSGFVLSLSEDLGADAGGDDGSAAVDRWGMLTQDPGMKRLFRNVEKVARSEASVLVRGETGSGKELVARAVHGASPRARGPFRAINCAALPPTLLESELFGHVRGSFTGAVRDAPGHFRLAEGGTLFLDEVGELPLPVQAKLLRALDQRTVIPVGGADPVQVDVRIVAATHRALRREVAAGRFREDLLYRVRVLPIYLPPLRERGDDVLLLARRFVEEWNARPGARGRVERIAPEAEAALTRYRWPGNVRELRNAIEFALVTGDGPVLAADDLPPELLTDGGNGPPELAVARKQGAPSEAEAETLPPEARRLVQALAHAGGHHGRAAASLGISRTTLWRRLRRYGLG